MIEVWDISKTRVFQDAKQEGFEEATVGIAKRLLERGDSVADVVQLTGLSTAEVQELIRKTQSFQEAREQGQAVAAVEIATRLLRLGRPVAEVVEATELSIAKVGSLKKRLAENSLKPIHTRRTAKEHL